MDGCGCLKILTMKKMNEKGENGKFMQLRGNREESWKKR